tara:strand:- start:131 stop:859 length:729 start_codon:yes stop_codon:yes gene_type:complete
MVTKNPSAPTYDPEYWNDFSWMHLNFILAEHFPEMLEAMKKHKIKLTPNNVKGIIQNYTDSQIAFALSTTPERAAEFRETVETLMRARQLSTNCYCHASNDSGPFPAFMKPWPGMIKGMVPSDGKSYEADLITKCVEADGGIPLGLEPEEREGFYKVYLFIRNDGKELHFVRENSNGEYSHKTALGEVTNLDNSGQIITDPARADMGDYHIAQIFLFPQGGLTIGIPKNERPEEFPDLRELS